MNVIENGDTSRTDELSNGISVDVEDWLQSTVDPMLPLTERFRRSTYRVLETFAAHNVKGTFFVLGLVAEKAPDVVRQIHGEGHEVQSHGYGHQLVYRLTPAEFRADLDRAKKLLEDVTGVQITGYRAPAFSIRLENLWALDILVETGHTYDSSIFPVRTARYGIAHVPRYPHKLKTPSGYTLTELPVASYVFMGRRLPMGGGGYIRLFPYHFIRRCIEQLNAACQPATIYMHPYEYDPVEFAELDYPVTWRMRLHQGMGRRRFPRKIDRLLTDFTFGSLGQIIASIGDSPIHEYRVPDRG